MAGGSGNAAATLLAMRSLARDSLTDSDLAEMAGQLGADAPFCLSGGTAVGRGRGDDLTPVDRMLDLVFVVTIPRGLTLSTASVYEWYDDDLKTCADKRPTGLGLEDAVRGLETGDLELTVRSLGNVLEPVVFARHPALRDVKEKILSLGAWCCHMTGSGSALYAVVPDVEMAHFIRRKILQLDVDVLMARSISSGARLVDVPNNAWLKGI